MSRKKISATDFIAFFNRPGVSVSIESEFEIDEEINFNPTNYQCGFCSIANVTFNKVVTFSDLPITTGIAFGTCQFRKGFIFQNVDATGYNPKSLDFHSLDFSNCESNIHSAFIECRLERGIKLLSSAISDKLIISKCHISMGSIEIEDSKLAIIDFSEITIEGTGLKITKSEIAEYVRCNSLRSNSSLSLIKSHFKKDIFIWGGSLSGITFNEGIYDDDVRLQAVRNLGTLTLYNDIFKKYLQIDYDDKGNAVGGHKALYLNSGKFEGGLIVNGTDDLTQDLTINCSLGLTGTLQFNSCNFKNVQINSDNHKANIIFNYACFRKIGFDHFNNYGNLIISSCKAIDSTDSEVLVYNSNLGKAQFQNFFFNSFKKVTIIDSLVSAIEFSGMHWFKPEVLDVGDLSSPSRRTREVYRQLKQASEKQNDKFQALEFQALELSAFRKEVLSKGKLWSNDGLILWLGQTNDYGLNWRKPMWILLLATTVLYFPIVISASNKLLWQPACDYSDLRTTVNEFIDFSYVWPQLFTI